MDTLSRWVLRGLSALAFAAVTTATLAGPALWRVSDADSSVWLFGSMHIASDDLKWRSPMLDALVAGADEVVFEMVIDEAAMAALGRVTMLEGILPGEETLADLLTSEQYAALRSELTAANMPPEMVDKMRPWLAAQMIASVALTLSGVASGEFGVEFIIAGEVEDEREGGLETAEEQMALATGATTEEQIAGLMQTISELDEIEAIFAEMSYAWVNGDIDALHEMTVESTGGIYTSEYRRMLSDRNRRWTEEIAGMLERNADALIIVGTGHLAGPVGVPALLEERGLTVERLETSPTH